MYVTIKKTTLNRVSQDKSLREMLNELLIESDVAVTAVAEEIGINKDSFSEYLKGNYELKLNQAIKVMKLLDITEAQLVSAYNKEVSEKDLANIEKSERLSYVLRNFDIPTLKKIGIIKSRSKIEDYEKQICDFFNFKSIYEYDDTSLMPTLFSKSKAFVAQEKEKKMNDFWLKCSIYSFSQINNPYEYNRDLLIELLKRISEFTLDKVHGYEKVVLILFRLGVTVLTQPYISGTRAFGVTMILEGKPCIVITDMNKKYHKLWINLLHELYHVINDFDILENLLYHISDSENPELLLNEERADKFALDALVNPTIQKELSRIVALPYKMNQLANKLNVDVSILYGIYLETLPKGEKKNKEFAKYGGMLKSSDIAVRRVEFDAVPKHSLNGAIDKMKKELFRISV